MTAHTARSPDSTDPDRKGVLLGHVIATKTNNQRIADDDMKVPHSLAHGNGSGESRIGHQEDGRTIAVHSLAVLPEYQNRGLGKILFKSYIQRMVEAENADRISILTYDKLVNFYSSNFGFRDVGKSEASFGGGDWIDMASSPSCS